MQRAMGEIVEKHRSCDNTDDYPFLIGGEIQSSALLC